MKKNFGDIFWHSDKIIYVNNAKQIHFLWYFKHGVCARLIYFNFCKRKINKSRCVIRNTRSIWTAGYYFILLLVRLFLLQKINMANVRLVCSHCAFHMSILMRVHLTRILWQYATAGKKKETYFFVYLALQITSNRPFGMTKFKQFQVLYSQSRVIIYGQITRNNLVLAFASKNIVKNSVLLYNVFFQLVSSDQSVHFVVSSKRR